MTTLTAEEKIKSIQQRKVNIGKAMDQALDILSESMWDFIVTFVALILALVAVFSITKGDAFLSVWGMFVFLGVYPILLIIRILRRTDTSYTNDEIGKLIEESILPALERIERNS